MKEKVLETKKGYKYALLITPLLVAFSFLYLPLNGVKFTEINAYYDNLENSPLLIQIFWGGFIPLLILHVGIILHECIHAFFFALFNTNGFKSIRIGFRKKDLVPYTHCSDQMKLKYYRIALLGPLILLGLFPILISFYSSNSIVWIYSFVNIIGGAADLILFIFSMKISGEAYVIDHPTKLGFYIAD